MYTADQPVRPDMRPNESLNFRHINSTQVASSDRQKPNKNIQ